MAESIELQEKTTTSHPTAVDEMQITVESQKDGNGSEDADEPSKNDDHYEGIYNQALACIPVVLLQFLINMSRGGWTAPELSGEYEGWLKYTHEIGLISGSILAVPMLEILGRKCTLWLVSVLYFVIWSTLIAIGNTYYVFASQFFLFLANGVYLVASTIYIIEICSPSFRGVGGAALAISSFLGASWGFEKTWDISRTGTVFVKIITAVVVSSSFKLAVEPVYTVTRWRDVETETKNTLVKLSPDRGNIDEELAAIQKYVNEEAKKRESWKSLFSLENLKALFVAVNYSALYATAGRHILRIVPLDPNKSSSSSFLEANSVWLHILNLAVLMVSFFSIERINRRTLFRWFYGSLTIFNIYASILLCTPVENRSTFLLSWLPAGSVLYTIAYAFIQPAAIIAASEILPQSIRAVGGAVCVIIRVISYLFVMNLLLRFKNAHIAYTILSAIMTAVIWRMAPETRGKALYNLDPRSWKGMTGYFPLKFSVNKLHVPSWKVFNRHSNTSSTGVPS